MSFTSSPQINPYRCLSLGVFILISLFVSTRCIAHPHSWVDIKTEILGNTTQITGFKMQWTFDAMTSAYMLDGEDLSAEKRENTLVKLADTIMYNMTVGHYLTYFYEDEAPIKYALAQNGMLRQDKIKLILTFELPLAKPKTLSEKPLKLLIYDPSYYVDMSWPTKNDIQLSPELAKQCKLALTEADPTSEQIAYVMSLPVDAAKDDALGELFTQALTITCKPEQG